MRTIRSMRSTRNRTRLATPTGRRVSVSGSATADKVTAFIPPHETGEPNGAAGEGVAVDAEGNIYAAEGPISREIAEAGLTKYLKP